MLESPLQQHGDRWQRGVGRHNSISPIRLCAERLQFLGTQFNGGSKIDQLQGDHESRAVVLPNQNPLDAAHHSTSYPHPLTNGQISKRLRPRTAHIRSEKLDLTIWQRDWRTAVSNNPEYPRRPQILGAF